MPLRLMFVRENGGWKIYGIQRPPAGLQVEAASPGVPGQADQAALIKQSMHDFAISVNDRSMKHIRGTLSQLWQKQASTEDLDEAFSQVYDAGVDLTILDGFEPIIEPVAALGESGELILKGYFPTTPNRVQFEQKYIYEGIGWKLFGFSFNIE